MTKLLAHCGLLFVSASFSLWNVAGALFLRRGLDPIVLATYREVGTAMCLTTASIMVRAGRRPEWSWPTVRESFLLLMCGAFGVFGLQYFFILGLQLASADEAALMQPLTPVIVLFLGVMLGEERVALCAEENSVRHASFQKLAGVAASVGGCVLISVNSAFSGGPNHATGMCHDPSSPTFLRIVQAVTI